MKIEKYSDVNNDINERTSKPKYTKEELKKIRSKAKPFKKEEDKKIDEDVNEYGNDGWSNIIDSRSSVNVLLYEILKELRQLNKK